MLWGEAYPLCVDNNSKFARINRLISDVSFYPRGSYRHGMWMIILWCILVTGIARATSGSAGDLAPLNNPDGTLNVADALILQRFITGDLTPTQTQLVIGDVAPLGNPDGVLNVGDLVVLMRAISGEIMLPPLVDDTPPSPVNTALVSVADPGTGVVTVTGELGSVEAYATVVLTNYETGVSVTTVADADGAFSVDLTADTGEVFGIVVMDSSGNRSISASKSVGNMLSVDIVTPIDAATINDDNVVVTGNYTGPAESGVTVNGVVACMSGNTFIASNVPLDSGSNTLVAYVTTPDGISESDAVEVSSTGQSPIQVFVDSACGSAVHDMALSVTNNSTNTVISADFDFDGDDVTDQTITDVSSPMTHSYLYPGIFNAEITVHDDQSGEYNFIRPIIVSDVSEDESTLLNTYNQMLNRLSVGAIDGALNYVSGGVYNKYREIFLALENDMSAIVGQLGAVSVTAVGSDIAELTVTRMVAGQENAFFVYLLRSEDGVWRVDGM